MNWVKFCKQWSGFASVFLIFNFLCFNQRAGAVFPPRTDTSPPIFTPPQTQPLQTYPPSMRTPGYQTEPPESSVASEFPALRYFIMFSYFSWVYLVVYIFIVKDFSFVFHFNDLPFLIVFCSSWVWMGYSNKLGHQNI